MLYAPRPLRKKRSVWMHMHSLQLDDMLNDGSPKPRLGGIECRRSPVSHTRERQPCGTSDEGVRDGEPHRPVVD